MCWEPSRWIIIAKEHIRHRMPPFLTRIPDIQYQQPVDNI